MFSRLFGTKKAAPAVPTVQSSSATTQKTLASVNNLGEQLEMQEKRQKMLQKKIEQEVEKAKEFAKAKNKRGALHCLKIKKLYEKQLEDLENQYFRLQEQKIQLESGAMLVGSVAAMNAAANTQKEIMKEANIDNVDSVMDNIQEAMDNQRQVQEAFGRPFGEPIDDDELDAELQELEAENLDVELLNVGVAAQPAAPAPAVPAMPAAPTAAPEMPLPAVPTKQPTAPAKSQEELELEALQAEMAL